MKPYQQTATHINDINSDTNLQKEAHATNHVFCWATLANSIKKSIYADITGKIPNYSLDGMQYIFIAYGYTIKAILS